MSKATDIDVSPSELNFRFQIGKNIPANLFLHNTTGERYAFKIKTTTPKKYCVRPVSGFIEPASTIQVEVIMQSQKEYPTDAYSVRDKFLLLTTPANGEDVEDVPPELFDKNLNSQLQESRLRVVLDIPSPPHTIIENPDEPDDSNQSPFANQNVHTSRLRLVIEDLRRQVERLEQRPLQKITSGFTLFHLLLVAVLAFLIGHYTAPVDGNEL